MKKLLYMAMAAALLSFTACDILEFGGGTGTDGNFVEVGQTRLDPESQFVAPTLVSLSDISIDQNNTEETVSFMTRCWC